ncbi:WD repeat-containing protein 73-like [Mercenaria mercenaria]|uniref:WD repeat-containing protein 73-like n=1 Tax=Mercenaria mercenaria TaxID=6596 RepID=UPI00234E685D|nr:WD repeat-containing protein 73-like [Mercenaria mercenaria]
MGDSDTDLMQEEKTVHAVNSTSHPTKISVHSEDGTDMGIAFGSSLNNITVLDAGRFEKIRDCSETVQKDQVSGIIHQTSGILNCCTTKGDIYKCDLRCEKVNVTCCHSVERAQQGYWTISKLNDQSDSMFLASTLGDIVVIDSRFMEKCVKKTNIRNGQKGNANYFCFQGSPDSSRISVSGLDGMVYIYNSLEKTNDEILEPVFVHEGHVRNCESQSESVTVVQHMWYPWQQDLIISTATDSSLHAWQYNPS